MSEIFLQLNDTAGVTLNKATTCNETVNVIGKLTAEGDFDVDIGATGTPEFRVVGNSVNCFEKLNITHSQLAGPIVEIQIPWHYNFWK